MTNGFIPFVLRRHSRQCFICRDTIFRSKDGTRCWQSEHGNFLCCVCMNVWELEGGELGKISRSKIQNGFSINA